MKIVLRRYKDEQGRELIAPRQISDVPLFQHCATELIAVTPEYFDRVVEPLLDLHGIDYSFDNSRL